MTMKKVILSLMAVLSLCLSLPACGERTYIVTYDIGWGGLTESSAVGHGETPPLPTPPLRPGCTFDGWDLVEYAPNGTEIVSPWNGTYTATGDVTLRARWIPETDTIYFDPNGGECDVESMTVYVGETVELPEPTRKGYYFAGWYFGSREHRDEIVWEKIPFNIEKWTYIAKWTRFPPGLRVKFGEYEQDNKADNGREPIEWLVLDDCGDHYLLLSRYVLDAQPLHEGNPVRAWPECSLRVWLRDVFTPAAFTVEEQEAIHLSTLSDVGTQDKVFLLSEAEINKACLSWELGEGIGTAYAKAQGLIVCNGIPVRSSWWYLRTKSNIELCCDGSGAIASSNSGKDLNGVRPAIWVRKDAVTICED